MRFVYEVQWSSYKLHSTGSKVFLRYSGKVTRHSALFLLLFVIAMLFFRLKPLLVHLFVFRKDLLPDGRCVLL